MYEVGLLDADEGDVRKCATYHEAKLSAIFESYCDLPIGIWHDDALIAIVYQQTVYENIDSCGVATGC